MSSPVNINEFKGLQSELERRFSEGEPVELLIGIDKDLTEADLLNIQSILEGSGLELLSPISIGENPWPNTLNIKIARPSVVDTGDSGTAILPLAVLLVGALAASGVVLVMGWQLGKLIESFAKNIPILAGLAAIVIIYGISKNRPIIQKSRS